MTKKLYQEDVYKKECNSTILEVQGAGTPENPYVLVLDETIFFPTGGGQPCDLGTIDDIELTDVFEKDGVIFHKLLPSREASAGGHSWDPGNKVHCLLDWKRRFEHMQRHCGEHILSGVFFRECGGVNRGFHMGSDYMTIDIDVSGITWEDAQRIETLTNEVVWSNVPVTVRYYENRSEAEKLPLRKALAIDEDISIVCVGDEANPADCVACCGTHPNTSGQVGLLKILRLESYKGMTRVYFKAGKEALLDYQNKHQILTELNQKYSSEDNNLLDKMKVQDEKGKEIRQELYQLKNAFLSNSIDEILKDDSPSLLIREYPYFKVNDLLAMSRTLVEKVNSLIVLISTQENTLILATSGKQDCGKIVKDNAQVWRGKGGGNAGSARAMFPSRDDMDCFISYVKQAYK
ncbi:MAG: alanyl-tRNA editing protein [Bacillota bacterium]